MDPEQQSSSLLAPTVENLASIKVFPLIPALRRDVTNTIDSALSWDQLTASDINFSIVRPLVHKYARLQNMAVVYACLVVRSYFLSEAESNLAFAGVMISRANLCEILAMKLLRQFAHNYIQLVAVLTTTWNPLVGASSHIVEEVKIALNAHDDAGADSAQSAIEMAISTSAKNFLASPVTQQVVNDIYSGRVVFSVTAHRSILADNYKPRAIEIYDPLNAPFINHYRLRVPKYGTYLDFLNFALLLLTFVLCLSNRDRTQLTFWEVAFITLGSAFALEEYTSSTEHGWIIYIASMWNAFDFAFIVVFFAYLGLRIHGLNNDDLAMSEMAFDVLACGACILFPRLAFFAVSNNMVVLSLRAMIAQFVFFIAIAAICFSGLLFTLWTLARDDPVGSAQWTLKSIAWLMVQIWFGNTYLSFAQASSFHPVFGPVLMTIFAALSNTLLLTILISILSNTVARIDANATQEYLFQYTITTIEGVKSDALFSYQPPFNILALVILKPSSYILTPRALHSANVFLIKLTSLPQLLLIGTYERLFAPGSLGGLRESSKDAGMALWSRLPRHVRHMPFVEAVVGSAVGGLYEAIFRVGQEGLVVGGGEEEEGELFGGWQEDEEDEDGGYRIGVIPVDDGTSGHAKRRGKSRSRSSVRAGAGAGVESVGTGEQGMTSQLDPTLLLTTPPTKSQESGHHPFPQQRHVVNTKLTLASASPSSPSPSSHYSPRSPAVVISSPSPSTPGIGEVNKSPLARLFRSRFPSTASSSTGLEQQPSTAMVQVQVPQAMAQAALSTEASVKHIEALLESVGQLPVNKLKEEMKELQDRQARIENLLLMLTRGMRNESSFTSPGTHRQSTMS